MERENRETEMTTIQEKKKSSCLLIGLKWLLAAGFVITGVMAVLLFNIEIILLNPATYQQALARENIYARVPALVAEQIAHSLTYNPCLEDPSLCEGEEPGEEGSLLDGPPAYMKNLDRASWEYILGILLPQEWLQSETESLIEQVFAGLQSSEPVKPTLSLAPLKANLTSDNLSLIVQTILVSAPPCGEEDLIALANIVLGVTPAEMPICAPPPELAPLVENELTAMLQELVLEIPDAVNIDMGGILSGEEANPGEASPLGSDPRAALRVIRLAFLFSPLLPLVLLGLLTLLAVRSWTGLGRWWGIPLAITGLLVLIPAAFALPIFNWLLNTFVIPRIPPGFTTGLEQLMLGIAQNIASRFAFWVGLEAGILFLGGCGMLIVIYALRMFRR